MRHRQVGKAAQLDADAGNECNQQAAHDRPAEKAGRQLQRRQWRHQEIDIGRIELRLHEAGTGVLEGILQDRHHDQAGRQKIVIVQALEVARQVAAVAEGQLEHGHEQQGRDDRGQDGLHPHLHKSAHFPFEKRPEAQPVDGAILADIAAGGS